MAYEEGLRSITLVADASLGLYTGVPGQPGSAVPNSGHQYKFVKVTGAKTVGLATNAANEIVIGVLQNKPQTTGSAATVAIRGVSKVVAGGSVNAGDPIKVKSSSVVGTAVAATLPADQEDVVGIAVTSGSTGEVISVLLSTPSSTSENAGPTGATGETGATGATGATGPTGPTGGA